MLLHKNVMFTCALEKNCFKNQKNKYGKTVYIKNLQNSWAKELIDKTTSLN